MATGNPTECPPWRILILDTSPDDPKWLLCTVSGASHVRAAIMEPGGRRYADWGAVTEWVRDRVGPDARLVPTAAMVWRVTGDG